MNILHANTDPDLLTRLKEMLGSSARADFAVGYFFIGGFDAVADDLARLDRVRILVGRADRPVVEEVAAGLQQADAIRARLDSDSLVRRGERAGLARQAVAGVGEGAANLPQSAQSERAVRRLRDMVAVGRVEVRAHLRSPLHAKAYLCWYENHAEPGAAVVGSSNLTLAGFSGNTELNVRVTGDAEMGELRRWFDALWDDSEDISDSLATELGRSWALAETPPYHVYLKALYELYGDELGEDAPSAPPASAAPQLANFQADAAARALAMIEAHGGCYIGDVVGLGKTFIGAEILRRMRFAYPNEGPPLILSPARLVPMWRRVNEMFGLGAAVVSHSAIAAPPDAEFDEETGRYADEDPAGGRGVVLQSEYPNRGAVLVDEAHNFRNRNKRYAGLAAYLESGDRKTVLMSATPQNLGPKDVYRQLRLFLDETEHGLNLEPLSLEDYFNNIETWHKYRAEHENYLGDFAVWESDGRKGAPPLPPPRPAVPRADMESVLTPVFIRRRRRDIRDLYGDTAEVGGAPVRFPTPTLANVHYRLDKVYAKAGAFGELQALLTSHKAARYRAARYIKKGAADNPRYADLLRARNRIAQLMGALLLKRLESSIEAFRSTVDALIRSNRNFRAALESGYVPIGAAAARLLAGESFDADGALAVLAREEEERRSQDGGGGRRTALAHPASDFKTGDWLRDIDADYGALSAIARRVKNIGADDDDKLRALKDFLADPEVKGGKVLIFSEAETTIEYLHSQLNPNGGDPKIARLTGSNRESAEGIIRRFSPTWNGGKRGEREIDVLLATDIVSEGQNLQDCARILNYDLHWNPVRLIQRFGRVDRIGTEHARIHLHSMWPDTEVDEELSLTERLRNRAQSFHDMIGLDSKLLSESERLNEGAMYRIYAGGELPEPDDDLDEVASNQRAIALLQRIQREDPDLWDEITNLPDGVRSALAVGGGQSADGESSALADGMQNVLAIEGGQPPLASPLSTAPSRSPFDPPSAGETAVLLRQGDIKACYAVDSGLDARAISPAQFVAAAECPPDAARAPLPSDTNARVMAAFGAFSSDMRGRLGASRRRRDTRNRRYLSRQLNIVRQQTDGEARANAETLRRVFLADVPPQAERHLTDIRGMGLEGDRLIARLNALRERYRLNPPDDDGAPPPPQPPAARIVCSDGLV